jgi:hypothetical protein
MGAQFGHDIGSSAHSGIVGGAASPWESPAPTLPPCQ